MPLRHLRKVHDFHGVGVDGDGPGHGGGRPVLGAEAGGVRTLARVVLLLHQVISRPKHKPRVSDIKT